jgi:hypothetical protein
VEEEKEPNTLYDQVVVVGTLVASVSTEKPGVQGENKKKEKETEILASKVPTPLGAGPPPDEEKAKLPTSNDHSEVDASHITGYNTTKPSLRVKRDLYSFHLTEEVLDKFDIWYKRVCVFGIDPAFVCHLWYFVLKYDFE